MTYPNVPASIFDPELLAKLEDKWHETHLQEPFWIEHKVLDKGVNEKALRLLEQFPPRLTRKTRTIIDAFFEVTGSLGAEDEIVENNYFNVLVVLYDDGRLTMK